MDKAISLLWQWCERYGITWSEDARIRFVRYTELLLHWQKQTNLTGFSTPEGLVQELFIDSLQILRTGCVVSPLLDVGTGAGFPAVPIKILRPEIEMILVEPRSKRYAFLQIVNRELGFDGMRIIRGRIESVEVPVVPGMAVSKAFAPLPEWLELSRGWAQRGAYIGCMVSKADWEAYDFAGSGYSLVSCITEMNRVYAALKADNLRCLDACGQ